MSINRQDIIDFGRVGSKKWEKENAEVLSCYDSAKLRELFGDFTHLETNINPVRDAMNEPGFNDLPETQQFSIVVRAIKHAFNKIFLTLFDRDALNRLLVVEETTDEAESQVVRIREEVAEYESEKRARQQEAADLAATPVEVVVDPIDQVVSDWHSMGSAAFKAKWINHSANRQVYELAVQRGLV